MNIPSTLRVGDTTSWRDEPLLVDGVRVDSSMYTLKHILVGPSAPVTLTAVSDGGGWKTQLTIEQANALTAGDYSWQAVIETSGERLTVGSGQLNVLPNLANATQGFDGRTLAEKALADAEARFFVRLGVLFTWPCGQGISPSGEVGRLPGVGGG